MFPYASILTLIGINKISNPIKIGETTVYVIPKIKNGGGLIAYEEVKHICHQDLINIKQKEIGIKKEQDIKNMFKIIISDDLHNKR